MVRYGRVWLETSATQNSYSRACSKIEGSRIPKSKAATVNILWLLRWQVSVAAQRRVSSCFHVCPDQSVGSSGVRPKVRAQPWAGP